MEYIWICQHSELLFLSGEQIQINKQLHFKIFTKENESLQWALAQVVGVVLFDRLFTSEWAQTPLLQHLRFYFFLKHLCNIFFLKKPTIFALEDLKWTCSPDIWATGSWFLPQELDPAGTAHMEQALSHSTVCFDSPKWSIQVTLAVQELSNVSMSTLCRDHAEVNLHPRSEPRFFQKSDIEHNWLDLCSPWLRSWQHSLCECPSQDWCETRAASCSQPWGLTYD